MGHAKIHPHIPPAQNGLNDITPPAQNGLNDITTQVKAIITE
jgi:hypothetical protein